MADLAEACGEGGHSSRFAPESQSFPTPFINVTAGIGILAQASPMMQDMFKRTPLEAGVVVSLISVFNAGGRFMWASGSDYIGRRNTYTISSVLRMSVPFTVRC
jgi:MFS family permease